MMIIMVSEVHEVSRFLLWRRGRQPIYILMHLIVPSVALILVFKTILSSLTYASLQNSEYLKSRKKRSTESY
jgi:hypothetical protein